MDNIPVKPIGKDPEVQWVQYACFDWETYLFHPDDRHLKEELLQYGDMGQMTEQADGYTALRFGDFTIRLRTDLTLLTRRPTLTFKYGDFVRVLPPRTERRGRIRSIIWNGKRAEPSYFLQIGEKRFKSRYFVDEIEEFMLSGTFDEL